MEVLGFGVLGIEVVVVGSGCDSGREHERVERGKRYGEDDEDEDGEGNLNFRMWNGRVFVRFEIVVVIFESEALCRVFPGGKVKCDDKNPKLMF